MRRRHSCIALAVSAFCKQPSHAIETKVVNFIRPLRISELVSRARLSVDHHPEKNKRSEIRAELCLMQPDL